MQKIFWGAGRGDASEGALKCSIDQSNAIVETASGIKLEPISIDVMEPLLSDQHIFSCVTLEKEWYEEKMER